MTKNDLRNVIETKLKIPMQRQYLDEMFKRADAKTEDGHLDYQEFLEYFRVLPGAPRKDGESVDSLPLTDLCKLILQAFGGVADVFQEMDEDGDGTLSREEFSRGLRKAGIQLGHARLQDLMRELDVDASSKKGAPLMRLITCALPTYLSILV